jgi:hypothetical protein
MDIAVCRPVPPNPAVIDPASLRGTPAGTAVLTAPGPYCCFFGSKMLDTICRDRRYRIAAR